MKMYIFNAVSFNYVKIEIIIVFIHLMQYLHDILSAIVIDKRLPSNILDSYNDDPRMFGLVGEGILRLFALLGIMARDSVACKIKASSRIICDMSAAERIDIIGREPINIGSRNGCIDCAWRAGETYYICSSKIGIVAIDTVAKTDLVQMLACFTKYGKYANQDGIRIRLSNVQFMLLIRSRETYALVAQSAHASSNETSIDARVIDIHNLDIIARGIIAIQSASSLDAIVKLIVNRSDDHHCAPTLRFHQELIARKVVETYRSRNVLDVLIGAMPRSGKTYIAASIAQMLGARRILVITTRPTETRSQWRAVFIQYGRWKVYDTNNDEPLSGAYVIIASAQYLKLNFCNEGAREFDIIIMDEIHTGGCTTLMRDTLDTINVTQLRIMMTATYMRPIMYYNIPIEHCFFWDLADLYNMCDPRADVSCMVDKYGPIAQTIPFDRAPYLAMPKLRIITNTMHAHLYERLLAKTANEYGFSNRALFAVSHVAETCMFQHATAVSTFLALVFGSNKYDDYPDGDKSILARMCRISGRGSFMVQMWFLPYGIGQYIADVKTAMVAAIASDDIGRTFDTFSLDAGQNDIAATIHERAGRAREGRKRGLIVLTGDVGSIGVSVPDLDAVFLLNDIESPDVVYQQMMRVMTEAPHKRSAIVIDFNVFRILNVAATYAAERCGKSGSSTVERILWCISNLISVDQDLWECNETPGVLVKRDELVAALIAKWRERTKSIAYMINKLRNDRSVIAIDDQLMLNGTNVSTVSSSRLRVDRAISNGIEVKSTIANTSDSASVSVSAIENTSDSASESDDRIMQQININNIIASIIVDIVLLCDNSCNGDLLVSLEWINGCDIARDALCAQLTRLYPKIATEERDAFETILRIIRNNYNSIINVREAYEALYARIISGLLDDPEALLIFLSEHLKPQEIEKKQMGEVFTPPSLINDMLNKLESVVPDIWSNGRRRFLDPAAGIGNFPAFIYARLMVGLSGEFPDAVARKRHILANMIFMCELNPKNVRICARIFGPNSHIHHGDFLSFDPNDAWSIAQFDVIVGNPPYNAPNINGRANGSTLYPRFIECCAPLLAPGGYQVFVHPGMWRKPGNRLHDLMFGRHIHYLEIHTNIDGRLLFGASTRYEWYILQNCSSDHSLSVVRFDDGIINEHMHITQSTPFLSNHGLSIIEKVRAKSLEIGAMNVRCGGSSVSSSCVDEPTLKYQYPFINSTSITKQALIKYSARKHTNQQMMKVIFANNGHIVPYYDPGYFGATQQGLYQLVTSRDEGINLCRFLQSRIMQYIVGACKWSMFRTEYEMFAYVPFVRTRFATDLALYTYFGLTVDEIAQIESSSSLLRDYGGKVYGLLNPRMMIETYIAISCKKESDELLSHYVDE